MNNLNSQLQKELKYVALFLIIMSICFYLFNNWYKKQSDTIYVYADEPYVYVERPKKTPVASPKPQQSPSTKKYVYVKVSHYNPSLGGVNCLTFVDGKCISKLANGESWEDNFKKDVIACPREWKFGQKIKIYERIYTCKDRGSKITKTEDGLYWVDILTSDPIVPYGQEALAEVL